MLLEMLEAPSHVYERKIAGRQGGINRLQSRALHDRGTSAKRRQIKGLEYRVACILFSMAIAWFLILIFLRFFDPYTLIFCSFTPTA